MDAAAMSARVMVMSVAAASSELMALMHTPGLQNEFLLGQHRQHAWPSRKLLCQSQLGYHHGKQHRLQGLDMVL